METVQRLMATLGLFSMMIIVSACSSEPKTVEECIERYSKGVENKNAVQKITQACAGIFDAKKPDDVYYKCLLDRLPKDKTDKDVNISIRKCALKSGG